MSNPKYFGYKRAVGSGGDEIPEDMAQPLTPYKPTGNFTFNEKMRRLYRKEVSQEELIQIFLMQKEKALKGDRQAAQFVLTSIGYSTAQPGKTTIDQSRNLTVELTQLPKHELQRLQSLLEGNIAPQD
jgi:hypothetical protein